MALMFDVLFYTFREGDPDGMPGARGESYGFVAATMLGRAELAKCSEGEQLGDIRYVGDEATAGAIMNRLSEDVTVHC